VHTMVHGILPQRRLPVTHKDDRHPQRLARCLPCSFSLTTLQTTSGLGLEVVCVLQPNFPD
jgi:hypothetical protein